MLNLLQIENIAVIEKAEIYFSDGMNVLTGETGAGKSIVIDAINAVIGGRCSKNIIRNGAAYAAVTAVFTPNFTSEWYENNCIECDESGDLLLFRKITIDGKNICRINGRTVTLSQLREVGMALVDVHGQNDGQKLLNESYHLSYLDSYADLQPVLDDYQRAYSSYSSLKSQYDSLNMDEGEIERTADMLNFQIHDIEKVSPVPGELEQLSERRDLLKNAAKLMDSLESALSCLNGSEHSDGALTLVDEAERSLSSALRYSDRFAEPASVLGEGRQFLEDAYARLIDIKDDLEFSPHELDDVEERLSQLKRLIKKYGPSLEDVLSTLEKSKQQLAELDFNGENKLRLEKKMLDALDVVKEKAVHLSQSRRNASLQLEKSIQSELCQLNMKDTVFKVDISESQLSQNGNNSVHFLMSANLGEPPGRISKIASGGELSRIMLAMKNVLAEKDSVGTLIFDEIDTGVSGIAAQKVGEKLWQVSQKCQVLCVTHLPQIAVMADTQFVVEKLSADGRTYTSVTRLTRDGRRAELARLSGGTNISDLTLDSAEEQLKGAEAFKSLTK